MNIVLLVVFALLSVHWDQDVVESPAESGELDCVESYLSTLKRIKSLEYRGQLRGRVSTTPDGVLRLHARHFKATKDFRYLELNHLELDTPGGVDKDHSTICHTPKKLLIYNHLNRTLEESDAYASMDSNRKLDYSSFDFYLVALGWFPEDTVPMKKSIQSNRWPGAMIDLAETKAWISRPVLNGYQCQRVRYTAPDCVTDFWLAEELGFMPVRIEQTFPRNASYHRVHFEFDSFQTLDGIHMPRNVKRSIYAVDEAEPVALADLVITDLAVNHLSDEDFTIPLEEGYLSSHFETQRLTSTPGGLDLLVGTISYGDGLLSSQRPAPQFPFTSIYLVVGVVALGSGVLLSLGGRAASRKQLTSGS